MSENSHKEPLHRFGRLQTTDVDLAQQIVSDVFEPHQLTLGGTEELKANLNAVQTGALTLGYLSYGTEAHITLPSNEQWYHVNITLTGMSRVMREGGIVGQTEGQLSGAILLPHKEQQVEWAEGATQFALKIPRHDLEWHLSRLTQHPISSPLELDLRLDLTGSSGKGLLRAIEFVISEWDESGILTRDIQARRQLQDLVLTNLLVAASGPHQKLLLKDASALENHALHRTIEYIHDSTFGMPTLADLTEFAGVSARTLQLQFRRHTGRTPMQYVRDVRLQAVRGELADPESSTVTVTEVAGRWGFYNVGRMSSQYRDLFGELPSETLRKALRGLRFL